MSSATANIEAKLHSMTANAVMSKFVTARECLAYRQALADALEMVRSEALALSERTVVCPCTPADRVECASTPESRRPTNCIRQSPNARIAGELMQIAETIMASRDTLTETDKDVIRKRLWELYS